ncbi:Capsular polysaccharide export system inner membrane protein KpsE [hydrothermal vent metagenome]|uniref:Capsular polysaccharide export system inner membrane protein KpsE n=1 Tax=hydrothermal vent metagenome TaxID=652676 RepID=A0A1W1D1Q5_9ZZZZ
MIHILLKLLFSSFFIAGATFIIFYETERYESRSIINIRDLSEEQSSNPLDAILAKGSPVMQESKLLELYIRSADMFAYLNKGFNFREYYSNEDMDILKRLYKETKNPFYRLTKENLLKAYNNDLSIIYDTSSTAIILSFAHADPKLSQEIIKEMIKHSSYTLNRLERENAEVALAFLKTQVKESEALFIQSIKNMIKYQNKYNTIDPNLEVEAKSTILAGTGKGRKELNEKVFDFELLKSKMTFSKEIYSHSLAKLEELKSEVNQNIKNLLIITKPSLAELYTYPKKPKRVFTLFIMIFFLYSILASMISLIRDHRD